MVQANLVRARSGRKAARWITASAVAIGTVGSAHAQIAPSIATPHEAPASAASAAPATPDIAAEQFDSSEIIVTARKREERLKDVPISITAFTGDQLTAIGAENFEDYADRVPGLSFSTRGPTSSRTEGVTLGIRGVSGGLSDPPVSFYIDDTPVGSVNLKLFDIDRIEVLKGPQGTLYGARAMGGLIKVVTRKADPSKFEATGGIELSNTKGGGFNYRGDAAINLPVVADQLALRVTGYGLFRSGVIDRLPGAQNLPAPYPTSLPGGGLIKNEDDEKTYGGRASLAYTPDSSLRITLGYIYENARLDGRSEWDLPLSNSLGRVLTNGGFAAEPSQAEFHNASLAINYDFGDAATLTSNTSGTWYRTVNHEDFTYFLKSTLAGFGAGWDTPSVNITKTRRNVFTQELRLASLGRHTIDWQVGLFYQHSRQTGTFYWNAPGVADVLNDALGFQYATSDLLIDQRGVTTTREYGAFAELNWNISSELTASAGARYFKNKFHNTDLRAGLFGSPASDLSSDSDGINPRFALSYKPSRNLHFYASATKGFRRGGANNVVAIPPSCDAEIQALGYSSAPATFESDNLWQYELGAKGGTANGAFTFEAAGFHIDWRNKQQNIFLPQCGFSLGANIGRSTIDGFEIATTLRPSERFSVDLTLGYLDARVAEDTPQANSFKGDRLPLTPRWTATTGVAYEAPVSNRMAAFGRADLVFRDKLIEPTTNQTLEDFATVNLRGGVKFDDYTVTLFVDNLTNKLGQLDAVGSGLLVGQTGGLRVHTLTPRTIGAELRVNF